MHSASIKHLVIHKVLGRNQSEIWFTNRLKTFTCAHYLHHQPKYQALTILLFLQHPAICEFPSKAFYNGRLKTDPSVMRRQSGLNLTHFWPKRDSPIVFCQVEGEEETGHIGSRGSSSQSKFNMTEAKKIVSNSRKSLNPHPMLIKILIRWRLQRNWSAITEYPTVK